MYDCLTVHPGMTPIEARVTAPSDPEEHGNAQAGALAAAYWQLGLSDLWGEQHISHESALTYSAVWACVRVIAESLSGVGWHAFERKPDNPRFRFPISDDVAWLLQLQANPETSAFDWRQVMLKDALLWGNGYAEIERTNSGKPLWLWQIHPSRVEVVRDGRQLWYQVDNGPGSPKSYLRPENMFHLKGISHDGIVGISIVELARRSIQLGLQEERFGSDFFSRGIMPGGIVTLPGNVPVEARKEYRKSFEQLYSGNHAHHRVVVVSGGVTFTPSVLPNNDAQFLESRTFQVQEICFVPGTGILTKAGVKPIEEVREGDEVLTHKGRWRKVKKAMARQYDGEVVTMQAKGLKPITATPNHPMFVQTVKPNRSHCLVPCKRPNWIAAGDLKPREAVSGNYSRRPFMNLTMPMLERLGHESVNYDDLGWLCGLYAADGSATDRQTVFYIGARETDITENLIRCLREQFPGDHVSTTQTMGGSVHRTVIGGTRAVEIFSQFGNAAHTKALPGWCMDNQFAEFQHGLIDGLVDGDGHERRGYRQVRTTSTHLAWQLRLLLWADGINSTLMTAPPGRYHIEGREGPSREIHTVEWRADKARRGSMGVGEGVVYFPLERVEKSAYSGTVHNLEVEEDETYTTVGGIAHNCRWYGVPPHKLADLIRATFSNIEEQERAFVTDCLLPWARRLESEADIKLFGPVKRGRRFTRLNLDALMRGNSQTQTSTVTSKVAAGLLTLDEGREYFDLNPYEGGLGETPIIQGAMVPLERILEEPEPPAPPQPPPQPPPPPGQEPGEDDPADPEPADKPAEPEAVRRVFGCLLIDVYSHLVRVNTDKARRAANKGKLAEHISEWYTEEANAEAKRALLPTFHALGIAMRWPASRADELAQEATERHCVKFQTELVERGVNAIGDWSTWPAEAVDQIMKGIFS